MIRLGLITFFATILLLNFPLLVVAACVAIAWRYRKEFTS
jgi:hypothetical protein